MVVRLEEIFETAKHLDRGLLMLALAVRVGNCHGTVLFVDVNPWDPDVVGDAVDILLHALGVVFHVLK